MFKASGSQPLGVRIPPVGHRMNSKEEKTFSAAQNLVHIFRIVQNLFFFFPSFEILNSYTCPGF